MQGALKEEPGVSRQARPFRDGSQEMGQGKQGKERSRRDEVSLDRIAPGRETVSVSGWPTKPKFQGGFQEILIVINNLRQIPALVSGYGLIN